jgi:hypothetical protein
MCKSITITRNRKVVKMQRGHYTGNYLSVELIAKLQKVASDNGLALNWLTEFALRKVIGMPTNFTEIKDIEIKNK